MFASIRLAAAAAVFAAALPAVANAAPAPAYDETRSVEVRYADLDLASDTGAAQLARRVAIATKQVCGTADTRDLAARQHIRDCRTEAMVAARPHMETAVAAARGDTRVAQSGGSSSLHIAAH